MNRTLVVTLRLRPIPDEAATVSALKLIGDLRGETVVVNWSSERSSLARVKTVTVPAPRHAVGRTASYLLFVLVTCFWALRFRPDQTLYFPLCAPRLRHQLHGVVLHGLTGNVTEHLFQFRAPSRLFRVLSPYPITVTSRAAHAQYRAVGLRAAFAGATPKEPGARHYDKQALRQRYGLDIDDFVVSHVGHNTEHRGLDFCLALAARNPQVAVVLVLSSRAPALTVDTPSNVRVIHRHVDDIFEVYHLSDAYLFPLRQQGAAVGSPLTLLEAAHARLPILCSDRPEFHETLGDYPRAFFFAMNDDAAALAQVSEHLHTLRVQHAAQG